MCHNTPVHGTACLRVVVLALSTGVSQYTCTRNTPVHGEACPRVIVIALSTGVSQYTCKHLCDSKILTSLNISKCNVDIKSNSRYFTIIILYVILPQKFRA